MKCGYSVLIQRCRHDEFGEHYRLRCARSENGVCPSDRFRHLPDHGRSIAGCFVSHDSVVADHPNAHSLRPSANCRWGASSVGRGLRCRTLGTVTHCIATPLAEDWCGSCRGWQPQQCVVFWLQLQACAAVYSLREICSDGDSHIQLGARRSETTCPGRDD